MDRAQTQNCYLCRHHQRLLPQSSSPIRQQQDPASLLFFRRSMEKVLYRHLCRAQSRAHDLQHTHLSLRRLLRILHLLFLSHVAVKFLGEFDQPLCPMAGTSFLVSQTLLSPHLLSQATFVFLHQNQLFYSRQWTAYRIPFLRSLKTPCRMIPFFQPEMILLFPPEKRLFSQVSYDP